MTEAPAVLDRSGLDKLVVAPIADGNRVVHPTVRDDAIVLGRTGFGRAVGCRQGRRCQPEARVAGGQRQGHPQALHRS